MPGFGAQAWEDYTPQQLFQMGKSNFTRVLCAYETNLPGSAAEKLAQRADLESMLNQLEEESLQKAVREMPHRQAALAESVRALQTGLGRSDFNVAAGLGHERPRKGFRSRTQHRT